MSGLFGGGGSKPPPPPKVVRMPVASDASILAARERARQQALRRSSRLSTILSDPLKSVSGSNGTIGL